MGKRDALYQQERAIEFDQEYFEKATCTKVKLKRGWGSQPQINVAVIAESTPLENIETGVKSGQCRYFKMIVLYDHKDEIINDVVEENFEEKSTVFPDKITSYVDISY